MSRTTTRVFDLPVMATLMVLGVLVAAVTSLGLSQPSYAANYPYHPMSVRDDRCYSSLSSAGSIAGLFGQPNFGMVNAIVNAPIYDWDQSTIASAAYTDYNLLGRNAHLPNGLRGSLQGRSVGYAEDFRFRVSPIPNLVWMGKYIGMQLPNDAGKAAWLAGQANPVLFPAGTSRDPYIANPFLYTQSALIMPSGFPQFQAVTGVFNDIDQAQNMSQQGLTQGAISQLFHLDSAESITNVGNYGLGSSSLLNAIKGGGSGNLTVENFAELATKIASSSPDALRDAEAGAENIVGDIVNLPGLSHLNSFEYGVRGSVPQDNCYESLTATRQVPSYAFSVPGAAIPVTMPGWAFSLITFLDDGQLSSSGMTTYLGGSINGKAMLDCYGRGVTATVGFHKSLKMVNLPGILFQSGIGSFVADSTILAAIEAAAAAADAAAPGSGQAIRTIGERFPALTTQYETYTSGFAFMFRLTQSSIKMPSYLNNRVIDYNYLGGSKTSDINLAFLIGGDGHNQSQNGQQFNPDIYLKLKRPFAIEPAIDIGGSPRRTLDGQQVSVKIDTSKYGFNAGNPLSPNPENRKYRLDKNADGGPTYDDNAGANGRSFTQARVYKIVMKPGVVPNAIDADKVNTARQTKTYYDVSTTPAISQATNPCGFFAQQLNVGDAGALPSQLSTNNSNANASMPSPQNIQDRPLGADAPYTCGQIASKDIRMTQAQKTDVLYDQTEKISAETPPGTKVCFAVYYTSYTNDIKSAGLDWWNGTQGNYNANYSTPGDTSYLSRARCIISGYKPSMQVRGGDLMVNGGVYTGTNIKDFLAASGMAEPERSNNTPREYGSWVEYGVIASGPVVRLGSGAIYRTGLTPSLEELGFLTFANNRNVSNEHDYGKYSAQVDDGFSRVTRQFTSMSGQSTETTTTVNLSNLSSGVYRLPRANVEITASGDLPVKRSIILLAQDGTTVTIASDVRIPLQYSSVGDISQVVLAPMTDTARYTLNINHNVSQVDAWLINPGGTINTCYTGEPSLSVENIPRAGGRCANTLTVNGPVSTSTLLLRRNGGKDQGTETTVVQSIPGENFNLRPDAYIWAANYVDSTGKKYVTTNSIDLPPRY